MSENNSNNDSVQENQHQSNFISPVMNSGNETGWKESGKAGDSPEEPAEKVVGKAKYAKPSPKRKVLKQKKKSRKRRLSISSSSKIEEIERKRRRKKRSVRKKKGKSPSSSSNVSRSDSITDSESVAESQTATNKIQGNTKRGGVQMEPPLQYGRVCQSPF